MGWVYGIAVAVSLLAFAWGAARLVLDRPAYRGAPSDHFDGARFRNPGDIDAEVNKGFGALLRWQASRAPDDWPEAIPVTPAKPPARVDGDAMRVTMVGHATVLVQTQGLNILTDPLWSERASPFGFVGPKRVRAPGIRFEDLPRIDLVLVSHNHYDHLDLPTLKRLWARDRPLIVTPLGNGALLARHGIDAVSADWGEAVPVRSAVRGPDGGEAAPSGVRVIVERVQHWSSRWGVDRNRMLWGGFTVELPGGNLYFAGDCGYDQSAFRTAASRGPIRLALLPVAAYEPRWFMAPQHMNPADAVKALRDLNAARAVGLHWGTFRLTDEGVDAPRRDLAAALAAAGVPAERFVALAPGEWLEPPDRNRSEATLRPDSAEAGPAGR